MEKIHRSGHTKRMTIGAWEYNLKTGDMFWTPPLYEIHGFDPKAYEPGSQEHIQASLKCYRPEDLPWILEKFEKCRVKGIPYEFECELTKDSGEKIWIRAGASPVMEKGRCERIIGHVLDITSQKAHEAKLLEGEATARDLLNASAESAFLIERDGGFVTLNATTALSLATFSGDISEERAVLKALKESQERYLRLVDTIQDVIIIIDSQGYIQFVNSAFTKQYGYSKEAAMGMRGSELVHPDYHPVFLSFLDSIESKGGFSGETMDIRKDGSTFHTDIRGARIQYKDRECLLAVIRDTTERKEAERLIKEREQQYRSLFENNIAVMLLIDPDTGGIKDANPAACSYYGYNKETLTQMSITEINTLSVSEVHAEMAVAKSEARSYFNFRHRKADGSINEVEVYSGPISVGGVPLLCSIVHDISERKQAEKDRVTLISQLQKALDEIKTLKGIVPICSKCKKIRDDKGYWNHLEAYLQAHSDASFSHGICPGCQEALYGNEDWYIELKQAKPDQD